MPLLRLTQSTEADTHRVEIAFEAEGAARRTAEARFSFVVTERDEGDLRWYLEDFLQLPHDPSPRVAARIEKRMAEMGMNLFQSIFEANRDTVGLWASIREQINESRIEIVTGVREATSIPWELLREPGTERPLVLQAQSFVRGQPNAARMPRLPAKKAGPIRILLVICRPGGRNDVPFRSVATRILKGLDDTASEAFDLDVLRPPTFEALAEALRRAKEAKRPYHIVHFDGHGVHLNLGQTSDGDGGARALAEALKIDSQRFSRDLVYPHPLRTGSHGYLVFENPRAEGNQRLADGPELGHLLIETTVPILVLNACRSAQGELHSSARNEPGRSDDDPHTQVKAWGSLAQEVMDTGACGVVAMRYNVYVETAAQFVADLYASLARGRTLGEAASLGRKQLHAQPLRSVTFDPVPLQDWPVPIVYEAAPIVLFPERHDDNKLRVDLRDRTIASPSRLDTELPRSPDAGFFGRDESLLALDRAFDRHSIVLLHGYAGSGKTATAAEFTRWYALTGGARGPALFTSFEHYLPLPRVLDRFGLMFEAMFEESGIYWRALNDERRRQVVLQALEQVPVLWIWDNVEPIEGFPAGTGSAWSSEEKHELVQFLVAARSTKARFLLTSRRDELAWLGDLPIRIRLLPMPMMDRFQLTRALAPKLAQRP